MSDDELLAQRHRHRDDGGGWCAADCKTGMFLHWHPCDMYRAVVAELDSRRAGVLVLLDLAACQGPREAEQAAGHAEVTLDPTRHLVNPFDNGPSPTPPRQPTDRRPL